MGKRLGDLLPRPGLIPEVDRNSSGGLEKSKCCVKEYLEVEKLHKPKILAGYILKVRRHLIGGELVVPKFQIVGFAGSSRQ